MKFRTIIILTAVAIVLFGEARAQQQTTTTSSAAILSPWLDVHCRLVKLTNNVAHVAYGRHFAYTAIAIYEACRTSEKGYRSIVPQLAELNGMPELPAVKMYWPAVLTLTYARMLRHFYTSEKCVQLIDSLEKAMVAGFRSQHINDEVLKQSLSYSNAVSQAIIAWAGKDNAFSSKLYTPAEGAGMWRPTPPSFTAASVPYWGEKRSFTNGLMAIGDSLKSPEFSMAASSSFYKMASEVYQTSIHLTPWQRETALYWDDSPNGTYITVFGHWTSIFSSVTRAKQPSIAAATAAYAAMTIAMHEASILTWTGKYRYMVLRPVTYIQRSIDSTWLPLIATPPHPEFPAAHASISYAAATALTASFGELCRFTDETYASIGMPARSYASFREAATEAGMSRLYGGIHYRYSIEQGYMIGKKAAQHVLNSLHFH